MKSWKPRAEAAQQVINQAAQTKAEDIPLPIQAWLSRLYLLYGVPFEYLVPDYRMLPSESIRWSFMDINWLERAMDGALSIGRTGSIQLLSDLSQQQNLTQIVQLEAQKLRSQLRQVKTPDEFTDGGLVTVMLIRSSVVGGYPGMEVVGLNDSGEKIDLLRMDPLAKDVLLVMFKDLPAEVNLIEPAEGVHFGVIKDANIPQCQGGTADGVYTFVRSLQDGKIGEQITQGDHFLRSQVFFRNDDEALGVIDLERSTAELKCWLTKTDNWPKDKSISPAEFAVEMIRAPGLQVFKPETNKISNGGESS